MSCIFRWCANEFVFEWALWLPIRQPSLVCFSLLLILEMEITCRTNICIARMFLYAFSHQEVGLHLFHSTQILILTFYFRYPLELRKDKPSKDKVLYEISSTQYLNPSITFWHFIVSEMLAMAILAFGTKTPFSWKKPPVTFRIIWKWVVPVKS